ncbi:hypothetical protein Xen7305DRAFT_00052740 [Xenococcus sp. PCC 7305]|uniref:hypothetical protein n=1 Tax=Xenococcus sp. PCC 7305 TaxID=102125 RepID=UPI0002AC9AE8|nr:hypothetical protein [Xenococcus sp. PCC 7305]ELS05528.1 hypothetical protein Xen7305DRAFT_00052740 [Xenococcus sp. PCC 7305]
MNLLYWQKLRLIILVCCNFTVLVALIFLVAKPEKNRLSQTIAGKEWELIKNNNILVNERQIIGRKYQEEKNHDLTIEIYYIPNNLVGTSEILEQYLDFEPKLETLTVRENNKIGHYGLFSEGNRAYLTTCLHSRGKTAFTSQQFAQLVNHNLRDRLFPWILGFSDLRDWSCFWVKMSISLDNLTEEEAVFALQQNLFDLVPTMKLD